MSPEEAFRRVLTARLPAGPGWTAWIDSTVQELAGSVPEWRVDREAVLDILYRFLDAARGPRSVYPPDFADELIALLQPVEAR